MSVPPLLSRPLAGPLGSPLVIARRVARRVTRALNAEVSSYWRTKPIDPNAILYESFDGNGILDNPEAIFRGILAAPDLAHLTHIWVLSDLKLHAKAMREFDGNPRVRFVRRGSYAYFRAVATSGYLINNSTFPPQFSKRPGQFYLNTWHGTPLKLMGYDVENGALAASNTMRNFLTADVLLAANRFMADQMYETAYKLKNAYRGLIVEEGYPRIDLQFMDAADAGSIRDRLATAGVSVGNRKIIVYAPTWKGTSFNNPRDDTEELYSQLVQLESRIDTERYVVLVKAHQKVHAWATKHEGLRSKLIPNELPTNALLGVTDILVTDYSSIFFDFLATGRPIMFYTPDIEDYSSYRGLYLETDEWPGPIVSTIVELANEINDIRDGGVSERYSARYASARERFTEFEDGHATERVLDIVFRGKTDGYRVRKLAADHRPSILIYLGGMLPNGITSSALNLLDHIDHEQFDVSACYPTSRNRRAITKQREINPNVRQLPRVGGMNGSKLWHVGRHLAFRTGRMNRHRSDSRQNTLWDDEWTRCFGDMQFDYIVDFSGYGPFWSTLLLHSPAAQRSIWLHNDLGSDAHRRTNGRRRMLRSLTAVFTLYRDYDHLVSVSPSLSLINSESLAEFAPPEKFVSAINIINSQLIKDQADAEIATIPSWLDLDGRPQWARRILDPGGKKTFVCVGRLSEEKNHDRLLRAFAIVHAANPATQLAIVGDGPLRHHLERLAHQLGLSDAVLFAGFQSNPHAIMVRSDCLVLSSDYEGQPMVILEALILGLPVVSVAFGSVSDALPEGSGLIVPSTDEGLASGMQAFLAGEVPVPVFDEVNYNDEATEQFYRAIGARSKTTSRL